ncbi:polysaccharide deacetylase family protein [Thermotalea metallivorans]|uniref:Peptidoglycan-N-acetylglucosamine deacetylase n=1 Tax=Thermotalea metallivorans TaxID=520762 RepID=A0A140L4J5_9FIRM|nr:polysaccharide deacetylase family protein [Thermotalea metallivorans]KXG75470.1 Peptidoglycan-N-acetylglucosamine deacetylase [Thermotalea metallivorans]
MKKFILCAVIFTLVFFPFESDARGENINHFIFIVLNDQLISFQDVYPEVKKGTTYVPIRFFAETMGADVKWNHQSGLVLIAKDGKEIILDLATKTLVTDGGIIITDCIYVKYNRIMAPFKLIAQSFGYEVAYIGEGPIARAKNENAQISDGELYLKFKNELVKEKEKIILEIRNREREEFRLKYKIAYITFDDGPSIYTEKLLQILNQYNAKATFFMLSDRIKNYPEIVQRVINEGNTVGLHGVTHDVKKIYKSPSILVSEMDACNRSLQTVTGMRTNLIRVPYGSKPYMTQKYREAVVNAGYKMWDWNVDSQDSLADYVSPLMIVENVKEQVGRRSVPIILLHERQCTVEALPHILDYLKKEGYIFIPIDSRQEPFNFWNKIY